MTHYTVQFKSAIPELGTVGSLEQERFQGTLEDWRGTHQLEFCWQPVPCSGAATENALSPNFRRVLGMMYSRLTRREESIVMGPQ